MDNKDNELKNALDEIFGDDVLEVDTNISEKESKISIDSEINEEVSAIHIDKTKIQEVTNEKNKLETNIKKEKPKEDEKVIEDIKNAPDEDNKKTSNISIKKAIIIAVLVAISTIILVFIIVNYVGKKQKIINCSYLFDDEGYKISDEYKITYENKSISYIEGVYTYQSKNSEFDSQIEYIKQDKLPVIINSNGIKGFTYTYENSESSLKVSSYLDYSLMDFNSLKQINQDNMPLAYFKVDLEENNKNLIKDLEKKGYKCTKSK